MRVEPSETMPCVTKAMREAPKKRVGSKSSSLPNGASCDVCNRQLCCQTLLQSTPYMWRCHDELRVKAC